MNGAGIDPWPHGYRVIVSSRYLRWEELVELARSFKDDFYSKWPEATARDWQQSPTPIITRQTPDGLFTGFVKTPAGDVEYRERGALRRVHGVALDHEAPEYGWHGRW